MLSNCFPSGLAPQFNALLVNEKALVLSTSRSLEIYHKKLLDKICKFDE